LHKPVLQRIAIVLAGPLMNLFFAIVLFMMIGWVGEDVPAARVGDIAATSAAYNFGFRTGDKILKINDVAIEAWSDSQRKIEESPNQPLTFSVERADKKPATFTVQPRLEANDNIFSFTKEVGHIDGLTDESLAAIVGVKPGSVAAKAGLQSLDLIIEINGHSVSSFAELEQEIQGAVAAHAPSLQVKSRFVDSEDKPENQRKTEIALTPEMTDLPSLGIESAELYIAKVKPGSPASQAGISVRDRFVAVDGVEVHNWDEVLNKVKVFTPGAAPLKMTLSRGDEIRTIEISPELTSLMNPKGQEEHRYTIGVVSGTIKVGPEPVMLQIHDPIRLLVHGVQQSYEWTELMVASLVRLAQGQVSSKNIGGIITIGRVASRSFEVGLSAFLKTMAIISLNLFLLNLLPVPVLDGGHLLFFSVEALKGTPISLKKLEIAQQVGFTLLIMLMAFAFFNDITNFFTSRW
jgi:regulator of sigma E protease